MSTLKILTHSCFIKQKIKIKNCLQCFSSKNGLIKHKEDCLSINGIQSVDIEEGIIKFENLKQLSVPFKIYADFECNLQDTEIYEGSNTKKYHGHVPCSYVFRVVCIDNRFSKPIVVYRGENAAYEFIKAILKEVLQKNNEETFQQKFNYE